MHIRNLIEYSDPYSKKSAILWQYYRDEPALDNNNNIIEFPADNNSSTSFKFKQQIALQQEKDGTKDVEIISPLKYLNNFWRTLEMPLINFEVSLHLKCSNDCFLVVGTAANQKTDFKITDARLYVPVVSLSTQDNVEMLKQLESGFKRKINWNKYKFKTTN